MDYLQSKKISNSSLSYINPEQGGSPRKFKDYLDGNLEHLETPSLYAGSTIHKFILEPDTFAISDVERPSDTIVKIIDKVYEITRALNHCTDRGMTSQCSNNLILLCKNL